MVLQTGIEPTFVLYFDCPEEEMEKRLLSRNQVNPFSLLVIFMSCSFHHFMSLHLYIINKGESG